MLLHFSRAGIFIGNLLNHKVYYWRISGALGGPQVIRSTISVRTGTCRHSHDGNVGRHLQGRGISRRCRHVSTATPPRVTCGPVRLRHHRGRQIVRRTAGYGIEPSRAGQRRPSAPGRAVRLRRRSGRRRPARDPGATHGLRGTGRHPARGSHAARFCRDWRLRLFGAQRMGTGLTSMGPAPAGQTRARSRPGNSA